MNSTASQTAAVSGFGYCVVLGPLSHATRRIPWPCREQVKKQEPKGNTRLRAREQWSIFGCSCARPHCPSLPHPRTHHLGYVADLMASWHVHSSLLIPTDYLPEWDHIM